MSSFNDWVDAINRGGMFGRRDRHDKALVELATAREWAQALERDMDIQVSSIRVGPDANKIPDCLATLGKRTVSIELSELIDHASLAARRAGALGSFDQSQWPVARLDAAVLQTVTAKQKKCAGQQTSIDALVIHSDELWLLPETVEKWLQSAPDLSIDAPNIRSAWLLLAHNWMLYRVFGDL